MIQGVSQIVSLVGGWLYFALMESSRFQGTLGKMAVQIKVTDMEGNRLTFGRATGRHFGKIVSGMILLIGYIMVAFTEKKQGLHDIMAGCLVVKEVISAGRRRPAPRGLSDRTRPAATRPGRAGR